MVVVAGDRNVWVLTVSPPQLMGWMAPAPIGVAMRHTADVHICL